MRTSNVKKSQVRVSPINKKQLLCTQLPSFAHYSHFYFMFWFRFFYALGILFFVMLAQWDDLLFHALLFIGSLWIPYLGRKDDHYYVLDCMVVATLIVSLLPAYFHMWPQPSSLLGIVVGFDKLFHMAGGACLGMLSAIVLRKRKQTASFYRYVVLCVLTFGIVWELFEWSGTFLPPPFTRPPLVLFDSALDVTADTIGALCVAIILRRRKYRDF